MMKHENSFMLTLTVAFGKIILNKILSQSLIMNKVLTKMK